MRFLSLLISGFVLSCCMVSGAMADSLVSGLQKKYDGITSMKSEFSQTLTHKESGAKEARKGTLLFKKPLLVRWVTSAPEEELLIVGKDVIWNVFPDEEVAYKYPVSLAQDNHSILQVVTGQARLDEDFTVKNMGKENGLVKLHLLPHEPVQSLVEAYFWVDPESSLIKRFLIIDFYGNTNEISFSNHKLGVSTSDKDFTFALPKGMLLEDRTTDEGAVMKKPLLQ